MQQEDDLRALAKIMDFLRAVSIILVVAHLYWYCYEAIRLWGVNIGVVDRILMNFHRTAGLFGNMLYTKLFALVLMGLSCLGTKGVKEEHNLSSYVEEVNFLVSVSSPYIKAKVSNLDISKLLYAIGVLQGKVGTHLEHANLVNYIMERSGEEL